MTPSIITLPLCSVSECWVSECWVSECWVSECWVSNKTYCYAECPYTECHYDECFHAECLLCWVSFMLNVVMLSVIILSVILLNVVAPIDAWLVPPNYWSTLANFESPCAKKDLSGWHVHHQRKEFGKRRGTCPIKHFNRHGCIEIGLEQAPWVFFLIWTCKKPADYGPQQH